MVSSFVPRRLLDSNTEDWSVNKYMRNICMRHYSANNLVVLKKLIQDGFFLAIMDFIDIRCFIMDSYIK